MELEIRNQIIKEHPFFAALSDADLTELAQNAVETHYLPQQTIVNEGNIIDAVYLVVSGDIEVDVDHIPKTVLHPGEAIGLTDTGFYSPSGLRTATLIATTQVVLIGWSIESLNDFLRRHPEYHEAMRASAQKMLRANFIKQAAPFSDLPGSAVMELAEEIGEVSIEAGITLFHQGDVADECYLVTNGEIDILMEDEEGRARLLAKIKRGQLFGESAILGNAVRNASARVAITATLLVLRAQDLDKLVHHPHTADALMGLVAEHWHPRQTHGITEYHRISDEGLPVTILKNKALGRYYQLSEEGWFIWRQLDGRKNLQEIAIELFKERRVFSPQRVADMILDMAEAGFVILPELRRQVALQSSQPSPLWRGMLQKLYQWRYLRWVKDDIDLSLTKVYNAAAFLLFKWQVQTILVAITLFGVTCFAAVMTRLQPQVISIPLILSIGLAVFVANLLSTIFHELAHALAVKYFGHEVHRAGIVFGWIGLAAYVDTSDMWLSPRWPRIIVSLAGPSTDLVLAGASSMLAFFVNDQTLSLFFLLLALMLYYSVVKNLNPLFENDGYAALKDTLKSGDLYNAAFSSNSHIKTVFWFICGIAFLLNISIALVAQHILRSFLPETFYGIATSQLLWILPALVVAGFGLRILKIKRLQKIASEAG